MDRLTYYLDEQRTMLAMPQRKHRIELYVKTLAELEDKIESGQLVELNTKPLTIEEMKALDVGDWVWIINKQNPSCTGYLQIFDKTHESLILFRTRKYADAELFFSAYGTNWIAYKNKEQAEAKGEIVELPFPRQPYAFHIIKRTDRAGKPQWYKRQITWESLVVGIVLKGNDGLYFKTPWEAEARLKELQEQ